MAQRRIDSLMEAVTNTCIGFAVSMAAWVVISPLTGIYINLKQNLEVTLLFTVISIARQYALRRLFDGKSVWQTIRTSFDSVPSCMGSRPSYQSQAENDRYACEHVAACRVCGSDCGQCGGAIQ